MKPGSSLDFNESIAANLARVRERISAAAASAGRRPADVTLVAVSKTFGVEHVRAAYRAGQRVFGENKVQEGCRKSTRPPIRRSRGISSATCNRTKPRKRAPPLRPSIRLIPWISCEEVDAAADEAGATPDVLIQVDLAGETTKFGAAEADVESILRAAAQAVGQHGW